MIINLECMEQFYQTWYIYYLQSERKKEKKNCGRKTPLEFLGMRVGRGDM